jgi:hypothetical protein
VRVLEDAVSEQPTKRRDGWDVADLLIKMASGIILLWFTVVVKQSAEDIATAMRRGELVQRLIGDLTAAPEARVRQDLAIIALDGSIGTDDSEMVAAIVEKLFEVRPATTEGILTNDTAYKVLQRRSPERAKAIRERLLTVLSDTDRQKVVSPSTLPVPATGETPPQGVAEPAAEARAAATVFSNLLYIQFQGQLTRTLIDELRTAYQQEGLATPRAERLAGQYTSAVRYFHEQDHARATDVAERATRFFADRKCPVTVDVQLVASPRTRVPKGQLELWISHRCG